MQPEFNFASAVGDWSHELLNVDWFVVKTQRATLCEPPSLSTFVARPIAGSPPPTTGYVLFGQVTQKIKSFSLLSTCPFSQPDATQALVSILKKWKIPPKSLTVDNGKEFAFHTLITAKTKVPIYFCHPYASYERGLNENHNGLLRQYFPKNECFTNYTQADLDRATQKLNNRPRKSLGYLSPKAYFAKTKKLERNQENVAIPS